MIFKNYGEIILGDCFGIMSEIKADVIFCSPPYNRKRNDKYEHYDDVIPDYYKFLVDFTENAIAKTNKVFINIQKNYYNKKEIFEYIGKFSDKIYEIFIWEKLNPLPSNGFNITNAYEFIIFLGNELKSNNTYTKNHISTSVNNDTNAEHKAIMNIEVADFFIKNFTKKDDIILDPFGGFFTTALACIKNGRKFICIEKEETYFNLGKQRIESFLKEFNTLENYF